MKGLVRLWGAHWRLLTSVIIGIVVLAWLLSYRLGSLVPGLSATETGAQAFSGSWHHIVSNPLNAPLTVPQWLAQAITHHHGSLVARLPSALFAAASVALFAYILRRWYGLRTAIFGTAIYATSAWLLHVGRFGGTEVLYLTGITALIALHIAWERHQKRRIATMLAAACLALLVYIPGMIWLVAASLILQPHRLVQGWKALGTWWQRAVLLLIVFVVLMPLILATVHDTSLFTQWLGLPKSYDQPGRIPRRLAEALTFFFWRGPLRPELWLDRLPIFTIFGSAMAILGAIFYVRHIAAPRTRELAVLFILGAVLYALGGSVGFSLIVPIAYLVLAAGVGYLLHEWLRVFPRNPLARAVGFALVSLLVILSCSYNVRAYFIAWPHNQATRATFHNHS